MLKVIYNNMLFDVFKEKQTINNSAVYRWLKYIAVESYSGNTILYNTLTNSIIALPDIDYDKFNPGKDSKLKTYLIENYFLVPSEFDDEKFKNQVITLFKSLYTKKNIRNFVIFPTLECNARCFYCFENGSKRYKMDDGIAADAADYIIRQYTGKKMFIRFHGGEPLYNMPAIDIISERLNANNIDFAADIISNGYLFTKEIAEKAKEKWHIRKAQITIDGTEEVYNRVKNYIYKDVVSPFRRVLDNIELLLNAGIKIMIRLNMDKHNCDNLQELVGLLHKRFAGYSDLLTVYVWLLYDNRGSYKTIRSDDERHNLTRRLLSLEKYIEECGFAGKSRPPKNLRLCSCMADSYDSVVILPNGKLGKCDHYSDSGWVGDIYNGITDTDALTRWQELRKPVELCGDCPIAPQCLRLKNCPDDGSFDCDILEQERRISKIKRQMRNAYDKYISENN